MHHDPYHFDNPVSSNTALFYARPDLPQKSIQKLKRGKITIEAELDLHGYTVDQAHDAVADFIEQALGDGIRFARVIHGKSCAANRFPILKNQVNQWLRQHPDILAFCSCQPSDGGMGAIYVWFRSMHKVKV